MLGAFGFGAVTGGTAAWKFQGMRLDSLQAKHDKFVGDVEHEGKLADERNKTKEAADKQLAKESNESLKARVNALAADNKRLRDADSSRRALPDAPANSRRPDLACFDRAATESAIKQLYGDLRGIAEEGDAYTVRLNNAKEWAKSTQPTQKETK